MVGQRAWGVSAGFPGLPCSHQVRGKVAPGVGQAEPRCSSGSPPRLCPGRRGPSAAVEGAPAAAPAGKGVPGVQAGSPGKEASGHYRHSLSLCPAAQLTPGPPSLAHGVIEDDWNPEHPGVITKGDHVWLQL